MGNLLKTLLGLEPDTFAESSSPTSPTSPTIGYESYEGDACSEKISRAAVSRRFVLSSPLDLDLIDRAIAAVPRSPCLNDLALAHASHASIEAARIMRALPESIIDVASGLCSSVARDATNAIRERDYLEAYKVLDGLADKLKALMLQ
jgi:hypothetical protein